MVVRISRSRSGSVATLRVEGHLDRDNLSELASEARLAGTKVVIDLSGLQSADTASVHALRELIAQGAILQGAPAYVAQLLAIDAHVEEDNNDG